MYSPPVFFLLCIPWVSKADKETGAIVPYRQIKPVLIVSIQVGMSAIIGLL